MARRIAVEIVGDSSSLEKALKRSAGAADKFKTSVEKPGTGKKLFSGLAKGAAGVTGLLGVGGLAGATKAAFGEMSDAQKVTAQTQAVLKSTGGAAGVTAGHVDKLADSLLRVSGVDDEAIKSGENLLLTFTNVRNGVGKGNQIFDQATRTMLNMSAALGQDTTTSAIQLGKALNDPIKGITALSRVGVSFTKAQKKQIHAMVDSGDTIGAQKVILAELNKEFGGSAEAAGKTLPGQLDKIQQQALNLGGAIAQSLTPQISTLVDELSKWFGDSKNQKAVLDIVKTAVDVLKTAIGFLKGAFKLLSKATGGSKHAFELLIGVYAAWKVAGVVSKLADLAGSFGKVRGKTNGAKTAAKNFRGSLAGKAGIVGGVALASLALSDMIRQIPGWDGVMRDFGGTIYDLASNLGLVNDQMKQFEGKAIPSQKSATQIRQQAARLEAGGLSPRQAADRLARQHPGMAKRDIEVLAGVYGRAPTYNIQNLNVHGVTNPRQLEDELHKRAKRRPQPRR